MRTVKFYTAGKMSGLSLEDQMKWRYEIQKRIHGSMGIRNDIELKFIHPPLFYTYGENFHKTEREVKDFDINHVKDCDIVIVNLDGIESSIGTHYELAAIDEHNRHGGKFIYVIGIGEMKDDLHPWIKESLFRHEEDYASAANYIVDYLLA